MLIKMSCFLPLQALWGAAYYSLEEPLYVTQVTYTWLLNHKCKHLVNWVPKTAWHLQPLCSEGCKASPTTRPPYLDNTHVSMLQEHVMELGKNSLDCLLIGELDLGRVCHCLGRPE